MIFFSLVVSMKLFFLSSFFSLPSSRVFSPTLSFLISISTEMRFSVPFSFFSLLFHLFSFLVFVAPRFSLFSVLSLLSLSVLCSFQFFSLPSSFYPLLPSFLHRLTLTLLPALPHCVHLFLHCFFPSTPATPFFSLFRSL